MFFIYKNKIFIVKYDKIQMFFLGKTHTMTGGKDGEMRGIIPRSVEQIIQQVMLMRSNGWEIVVTTSMVRSLTRS